MYVCIYDCTCEYIDTGPTTVNRCGHLSSDSQPQKICLVYHPPSFSSMAPSSPRPIPSPATFLSDLTQGQKQGHPSMKFLLEFPSCCGPAPPRSPFSVTFSSSRYGERRRPSGHRRPTRRPPPSRRPRRALKRRRLAPRGDWRPTLVTIYEYDDNGEDEEVAATRRSDASMALLYDYDSRRGGAYRMMTEFYPMPYMF